MEAANKKCSPAPGRHGLPWGRLLFSLAGGLAFTGAAFLLFAYILSHTDLPLWAALPFSTAALELGTLSTAYLLGRSLGRSGALLGLLAAAVLIFIFMLAAFLEGIPELGQPTLLRSLAILAGGLLGGLAADRRCARSKARRHS